MFESVFIQSKKLNEIVYISVKETQEVLSNSWKSFKKDLVRV